ncbi:short-subunit dehydrogenase [Evansella vedderi]|uniref:Short-subunit dehydrogenase n=1 Tax=Evansella vedderi TaxID=38282 RepID=A0ABT9ZZ95_9BACI|nr:SDR family oxidoreductase [Evansella vedderi]MDQ0256179.1 short-subunit dehydrogenase [Evansella vedderi]
MTSVVITGASSGIGEKMAFETANRGWTPIMLARSYDKLMKSADQIKKDTGVSPYIFQLDVTDQQGIETTFAEIIETIGPIDVLINNAGFAVFELAHESSMEIAKSMFQVNVFGAVACTKAVLPKMMERNSGHIIFIASQAGKLATPKSSIYSATKHALLGYANSLRMELGGTGIQVSTVNPGPIRTPFFDTADETGQYRKNVERFMLDPEIVAARTIDLIKRPKRELNLPKWMGIGTKIYQLFPGVVERIAGSQLSKK